MNNYVFGMLVTWALFGSAWVMILFHCLYVYGKAYVHDTKVDGTPSQFIPDSSEKWIGIPHTMADTGFVLFFWLGLGFLGGAVWPIAWPAIFCIGVLRGARTCVRFQTSYKAHKHDKETGEIA